MQKVLDDLYAFVSAASDMLYWQEEAKKKQEALTGAKKMADDKYELLRAMPLWDRLG